MSAGLAVAETAPFAPRIATLLFDEERADLIAYLAEHPGAGVIVQGTGGIRKLRWARRGKGKRGGIRVIYYFHSDMMPLYLLAAFGKNEKANISTEEKRQLARAVNELVASWRQRHGQGIH